MFQAQDGLIQFIFANEDTYFTDSGLRLNLVRWLYGELYGRYQHVFFFREQKRDFGILVFDSDSWNIASEQTKKLLPFTIKGTGAYRKSKTGSLLTTSPDSVFRLLRSVKRSAFVFEIASFAKIMAGNEALLSQLRQENALTQNLLLIRGSIQAEYNRAFFRDTESVFHSKTDRGYLFPEIVQAFCEPDEFREGCYRKLQKLLGEGCIFLNRFSREAILPVVWNAAWHKDNMLPDISEKAVEEITDFIYCWYHSNLVQARWNKLFHSNDRREFRSLYTDLTRNWDEITQAAAEFRVWRETDGYPAEDVEESFCVCDSSLIKRLKSIRPQAALVGEDTAVAERIEIQKAYRLLLKERTQSPDEDLKKLMLRVTVRMERGALRGDLRTVRYGGECLQFACNHNYSMKGRPAACLRGYDFLLELTESLFAIETGTELTEQSLSRIRTEFADLMSELEGGMTGLGGFGLKAKADRAENLQKKAELTKGLVRSDYDRITILDQMVIKLEAMIREVANIREYNSESADIIRELSSQLRQSPEKELRDFMNTWV